jgi:signal transduction histidine kinase
MPPAPDERPGTAAPRDDLDAVDVQHGDAPTSRSDGELANRVLSFLAELGAVPADEDVTLASGRIARLLVPRIVDGAAVELIEDGATRLAATVHARVDTPEALKFGTLRVALAAGSETIGYLTVWLANERPFAPADLGMVEAAAQKLAGAVERRRLRTLAEEALLLRDRFLGMASHELRTPLQAIGLAVQLVLTRLYGAADEIPRDWLVSRLERTQQEIVRMRFLVDALLDATALRSGKVDLVGEPVDLADVVHEAVDRLRDQLTWSRTPCSVSSEGPTAGIWDRQRLEIIVTNLLTNAMKYGAERPIHIELRGDEERVVLAVSDHGMGIASADLTRLFRPFERLAQGSQVGGFGLGLWTVKQLVEAMAGTVSVASASGAGSTFTVSLPRRS